MFLTRIGFGSKVAVTGDLTQKDLPAGQPSGLDVAMKVLSGFTTRSISSRYSTPSAISVSYSICIVIRFIFLFHLIRPRGTVQYGCAALTRIPGNCCSAILLFPWRE